MKQVSFVLLRIAYGVSRAQIIQLEYLSKRSNASLMYQQKNHLRVSAHPVAPKPLPEPQNLVVLNFPAVLCLLYGLHLGIILASFWPRSGSAGAKTEKHQRIALTNATRLGLLGVNWAVGRATSIHPSSAPRQFNTQERTHKREACDMH